MKLIEYIDIPGQEEKFENAFGILAVKWRIYIQANMVHGIAKAAVCLHNYLRLTNDAYYLPTGFVDCEYSIGNIIYGETQKVNGLIQLNSMPWGK